MTSENATAQFIGQKQVWAIGIRPRACMDVEYERHQPGAGRPTGYQAGAVHGIQSSLSDALQTSAIYTKPVPRQFNLHQPTMSRYRYGWR